MIQRNTLLSLAVFLIGLAACGPNKQDIALHPEILKLRVMLDHGSNGDDFEKEIRATRLDYELHKSELSSEVNVPLGKGLDALEILITIPQFLQNDVDPHIYYDDLHRLGVYRSRADFEKETRGFVTKANLEQIEDPQRLRLTMNLDESELELMILRVRKVASQNLKQAEHASIK